MIKTGTKTSELWQTLLVNLLAFAVIFAQIFAPESVETVESVGKQIIDALAILIPSIIPLVTTIKYTEARTVLKMDLRRKDEEAAN